MNDSTKTTIDNLVRHGFKSEYFENKDDALNYVIAQIGGEELGIGGSMTITELDWYDALSKRGAVYCHTIALEDKGAVMLRANAAPCYMLSANAISQNGDIVNIDGNGNRVTATSFGHKKIFYICGENKIAENLEQAIFRAKNVAAPQNCRRLNRKTPCAIKADKCYNCNSPERICRVISITTRPPTNMEIHVLFIAGNWGY
jgi:Uncharacterised ACR, YkgG family COG1556.